MDANGLWTNSALAQIGEWHGMARTFGVGSELYPKDKLSSLDVASRPFRAEGVGLEPTSPFGTTVFKF